MSPASRMGCGSNVRGRTRDVSTGAGCVRRQEVLSTGVHCHMGSRVIPRPLVLVSGEDIARQRSGGVGICTRWLHRHPQGWGWAVSVVSGGPDREAPELRYHFGSNEPWWTFEDGGIWVLWGQCGIGVRSGGPGGWSAGGGSRPVQKGPAQG